VSYKELDKPLYHGTYVEFTEIDLAKSAPKKDFGRGFYTTNDQTQAKKFARLKAAREKRKQGCVIAFKFVSNGDLKIKEFKQSDREWFDFVLRNRGFGQYATPAGDDAFDIIIGPVANDAVGIVLNNFIDGVYGEQSAPEAKDTAIRLLLTQKLHNQVFFATQRAVGCLTATEIINVYFN
jgi:hypothetical protein